MATSSAYSLKATWPLMTIFRHGCDLFLNLKAGSTRRRYFLDVLDDTKPFFVGVRKVHNYINYAADNDWPDEAGRLPTVLAICKDDQTQRSSTSR